MNDVKTLLASALMMGLCVSAAAQAQIDTGALLRCRAVADNAARLACYDAAVGASRAGQASATSSTTPATPSAAAAAPSPSPVSSFGLEDRVTAGVDAVTSTLVGTFDGWGPRHVFRLANGQVWRMVESSRGDYPARQNPKVTVRRAFGGSFLMEIEGVNAALRVRRVE